MYWSGAIWRDMNKPPAGGFDMKELGYQATFKIG